MWDDWNPQAKEKKLMQLHLMHLLIGTPNQHDDKSTVLHKWWLTILQYFKILYC